MDLNWICSLAYYGYFVHHDLNQGWKLIPIYKMHASIYERHMFWFLKGRIPFLILVSGKSSNVWLLMIL